MQFDTQQELRFGDGPFAGPDGAPITLEKALVDSLTAYQAKNADEKYKCGKLAIALMRGDNEFSVEEVSLMKKAAGEVLNNAGVAVIWDILDG